MKRDYVKDNIIEQVKHGDTILVEKKINWRRVKDWLIALIHIGQNVSTFWGLSGKWFSYHHAVIVYKHPISQRLYYFEAAERCRSKHIEGLTMYKKAVILRPNFMNYSEKSDLYKSCMLYKDRVYDYRGTLFDQFIRYFSELIINILTLGRGKGSCIKIHREINAAKRRAYCSELVLEIYNLSLHLPFFNSQHMSPKDIYKLNKLKLFTIVDEYEYGHKIQEE